jgi:hypothetical protein
MLQTQTEQDRLFEHLDRIEAEVKKLQTLGINDVGLEKIAIKLRISLYSYKRLSSNTMIEVVRTHNGQIFSRWSQMWNEMQDEKSHPRELKSFHDYLVRLNEQGNSP